MLWLKPGTCIGPSIVRIKTPKICPLETRGPWPQHSPVQLRLNRKLSISVSMTTNQNQSLGQNLHDSRNIFCKTFVETISSNKAINGSFRLFPIISHGSLTLPKQQDFSYNRNKIGTKHTRFFNILQKKIRFMSNWQPIKFSNFDKIHIERTCNKTIQISRLRQKKLSVSNFPIVSLWINITCHGNQSYYPIEQKSTIL